jgi:hypothetical protein
MEALGHQTQRQTIAYHGVQAMEVAQIFVMELQENMNRINL